MGGRTASRRVRIADAGIKLIASSGVRALTHRAVDARAQLPAGSTSYYARTRRELLRLIVDRLAQLAGQDLEGIVIPATVAPDEAARVIEGLLVRLLARADAQIARSALLFELRDDAELRGQLGDAAPERERMLATARQLLGALGAARGEEDAEELVSLIDALLVYRSSGLGRLDSAQVLCSYFVGLRSREKPGG